MDDDAEIRELLGEYCRTLGLLVTSAHDGRAAIDAVRRAPGQFGIVITDLHMPGADGFAVLQAVREVSPACYVVMISGYGTIDGAVRAVREGAYDYLTKPFTVGQLEVTLGRIRDRMGLEREREALAHARAQSGGAMREVIARLDAIESRLSGIESALRRRP